MKKQRQKVRVGDVFEIPLSSGTYAYGRVYRDASVGIYSRTSSHPSEPPIGSKDFMFHVGMYQDILRDGELKIVGHDPFDFEESDWPPPYCVEDPITSKWSIYHRGEFRPAAKSDCAGLEPAAAWDLHHILERIEREVERRAKIN